SNVDAQVPILESFGDSTTETAVAAEWKTNIDEKKDILLDGELTDKQKVLRYWMKSKEFHSVLSNAKLGETDSPPLNQLIDNYNNSVQSLETKIQSEMEPEAFQEAKALVS